MRWVKSSAEDTRFALRLLDEAAVRFQELVKCNCTKGFQKRCKCRKAKLTFTGLCIVGIASKLSTNTVCS